MPKLHQIVAVVSGKKTRIEKEFGDLNKIAQKADLFHGLTRTYQPLEDGGEVLPSEKKYPQKAVKDIIAQVRSILTDTMDAICTQEYGNCIAKADIKVDGKAILSGVPVTAMLYIDKQLEDIRTFVSNLPTLDPAERWVKNEQNGQWELEEAQKTIRTKKVNKPLVLYAATDKHPAQTQLVVEDVTAGTWTTQKMATVLSSSEKQDILARITKLSEAVKVAREEANSVEVQNQTVASPILSFVFGGEK